MPSIDPTSKSRPAAETAAYNLEQVLTMIEAVPEPASTLLAVAAFSGARRGELRGMNWEDYRDGQLYVSRSIWNGKLTEPKSPKNRAPIPVIPRLAKRLEQHRKRSGNPVSGPMFPNAAGNPVDPDSILRRVILPVLNVCVICNKVESDHGREIHTYERNTSLLQWHGCSDTATSR